MKKISEHDLFDAIGNIDHKYIKNAEKAKADPAQHPDVKDNNTESNQIDGLVLEMEFESQAATLITPTKRSRVIPNVITRILVSAAVLVAFIGGAYAYKMFHKADTPIVGIRDTSTAAEINENTTAFEVAYNDTLADPAANVPTEPPVTEKPADKLSVPEEEITQIIIHDGTTGYSRTIANTSGLREFFNALESVSGTAVKDKAHRDNTDCKYSIACYSYGTYIYSYYILSETAVREKWLSYGGRMIQSDETNPLYTYAKEQTDPEALRGAFPNPENAYDAAKTQYMILKDLSYNKNGYRATLGTHTDDPLELVEVSCSVRYTNDPDLYISLGGGTEMPGYTVPIENLKGILVPVRYAEEVASHDMIIIRRGDIPYPDANVQHSKGYFCLPAYTQDHDIEYLAIDDGKLVFPDGTPTNCLRCFAPVYVLNEEVAKLNLLSPSDTTQPTEDDMPRLKMYDGMPLQEVIEYFDAFKKWADHMAQQTD
ncbi:MAG: hypothetical protein J5757_09180 [Lachnospiraceae bacterium]|nr:hypothetical protein [Lachnospiraceae bacterium]